MAAENDGFSDILDLAKIAEISSEEKEANSKFRLTVEPAYCAVFFNEYLSDSVLVTMYMRQTCEVQLQLNSSVCEALGTDTPLGQWAEEHVQPHAIEYFMWKLMLMSFVPAILSLFICPWTDRNGRKPALLFCQIGMTLTYCVFLCLSFIPDLHPAYLLIGVMPFALMGGKGNLLAVSLRYMVDVAPTDIRIFRLGVLATSRLMGGFLGLLVSPYIFNWAEAYGYGYNVILVICAAAGLISVIHIGFCIPESVINKQEKLEFWSLFDLSQPVELFRTTFKARPGYNRTILLSTIVILSFNLLTMNGENRLLFLLTRLKFQWDLTAYHNFKTSCLALCVIGMPIGVWLMPKYLHLKPIPNLILCWITRILQSLLMAVASSSQSYFMYLGGVINFLKEVSGPITQEITNSIVSADEIGAVFAFSAFLGAIMPVVAGPIYVQIYSATLSTFPGAFLLFSSVLYVVDIILSIVISICLKSNEIKSAEVHETHLYPIGQSGSLS